MMPFLSPSSVHSSGMPLVEVADSMDSTDVQYLLKFHMSMSPELGIPFQGERGPMKQPSGPVADSTFAKRPAAVGVCMFAENTSSHSMHSILHLIPDFPALNSCSDLVGNSADGKDL